MMRGAVGLKKAIIIGAGPAGLTAAYKLLKETDIVPIVLEESDTVGGISKTVDFGGNRMDMGGHRFFSKNAEIMRLWQEIMPLQSKPSIDDILLHNDKPLPREGGDPEADENVMLIRRRVSRIFYLRHFFDYPISLKPATFANMGLWRTLRAGFGYIASCLHKRQEKSLEDFYINRFGRPLYSMFFERYTEKLWGVHPSQIAPDWGAQRVKGLSLSSAVRSMIRGMFKKADPEKTETSLIEQFYYPKRGPGQLYEQMADRIREMGGEIRFNTPVDQIETDGGKITAVISRGQRFEGDYFLSSMPIKDLIGAMNGVPEDVCRVAEALPYRDFITVGLLLNKLKLKNKTKIKTVSDIVPDCWIYIQEPDVLIGRLQIFNNWSPYMVKDFENTVFAGLEYFCSEGDDMWNMSDEEFIRFAVGELVKIGIIEEQDVLDAVRIRVKKAYPAYFGAYAQFRKVRDYLDTVDNLYCIGRNGQHRYNNMDHSMLTAIEAVNAIMGKSDRRDVWSVNTESEYHESAQ